MRAQNILAVLLAGAGSLTVLPMQAATTTGTIAVSATVVATCVVGSGAIAFGNYAGSELSGSTTLAITCTNGTGYSVLIDAGSSGGDTTTRLMAGPGTDKLQYKVWQDASHTVNWNDTDSVVAGTGNGLVQTINVYATVPSSQTIEAGAYTDTLTVTVSY
ncbi:MAG: spore coat U domain-containing protein [Limnobacter sp.]|nr:spore coat U domain-containing protein [Limnobacter sp.]